MSITTSDIPGVAPRTRKITITALWVVGSYARGALECGDLDVVLEVQCDSGLPFAKRIGVAAFGPLQGVRYYTGTAQTNSSGVAFPEAVRVWSSGGDWRRALASITDDPSAGHFARPTDVLPLHPEQMQEEQEVLLRVIELKSSGSLDWRFMPLESLEPLSALSEDEALVREYAERVWGKHSRELLPAVLRYLHSRPLIKNTKSSGPTELECSGVRVIVGRPHLPHQDLDELACSHLVLVPHRSRRGPNGLWDLFRGKGHPLMQTAGRMSAFVIFDVSGKLRHRVLDKGYLLGRVVSVPLFATERAAKKASARDSSVTTSEDAVVRAITGAVGLIRFGGQVDYAACRSRAALSNSAGLM